MKTCLWLALLCGVSATAPVGAQSLRLAVEGADPDAELTARVGDVLVVHLVADLASAPAAGVAAYLTVPDGFGVADQGLPGQPGVQPFRFGDLFERAQVPTNALLPDDDGVAAAFPGQQLDLAAVFGLGRDGAASGIGVVASFQLTALQPMVDGAIRIDDNPVRETRLVLVDDGAERRFRSLGSLSVTVTEDGTTAGDPGWAYVKISAAPSF